ncbi:hypothetical protein AB7849_15490 [Rhodanobacter sp. 115]|uniref:hypothetical protein n=1 Tax=Rhodanobacter sp. FW021-MT20 TaxID=1162282 RepID=UPI0034E455B2
MSIKSDIQYALEFENQGLHPVIAKRLRGAIEKIAQIEARDAQLNRREVSPTGADYERVFAQLTGC